MKPGFIAISLADWYRKVWPAICNQVEVIHSNLPAVRAGKESVLIVEWGYPATNDRSEIIIAVTRSDGSCSGNDQQWVSPQLASHPPAQASLWP